MLRFESSIDHLRFAFTDRHGGVSDDDYATLNLGGHVGDVESAVSANRAQVADAIGLPAGQVLFMNQVHAADVAVVDKPWDGPAPDVDAMVTTRPGLALGVLVADCVPVLFGDAKSGVVAVAHAGRPGLAAGVVPATVGAMRDLGADDIAAKVGPSVCGQCYEVPERLQAQVSAVAPEAKSTTRAGTPGLDIRAGVRAQLAAADVAEVDGAGLCTMEDPDFYSYRRDRTTGRFAGLAWITE